MNANDARSVHLWYNIPQGITAFYNEVTVEESHPGSYFSVIGSNTPGLYCGIQELPTAGQKQAIFSMWNDGANGVKLVQAGPGVKVSPFGNEGTGLKAELPYNWQLAHTYRFAVNVHGPDTFSCQFFDPVSKQWNLIAIYQRDGAGQVLGSVCSFVEDFKRDGHSATVRRAALFSNAYASTTENPNFSILVAKFAAVDNHPSININAQSMETGFRLETGGNVHQSWPLNKDLPSRLTSAAPSSPLINEGESDVFISKRNLQDAFGQGQLVQNQIINNTTVQPTVISDKTVTSVANPVIWNNAKHVFWRDDKGALWDTFWNGQAWEDNLIFADANILGAPVPLATSPYNLKMFWRDTNAQLWFAEYRDESNTWMKQMVSSNYLSSDPAPVSTIPRMLSGVAVFWKGLDGQLWMTAYAGNAIWKDSLVTSEALISEPVVYYVENTKTIHVYAWLATGSFVGFSREFLGGTWQRTDTEMKFSTIKSLAQPKMLMDQSGKPKFVLVETKHDGANDIGIYFLKNAPTRWYFLVRVVEKNTQYGSSAPAGLYLNDSSYSLYWKSLDGNGKLNVNQISAPITEDVKLELT